MFCAFGSSMKYGSPLLLNPRLTSSSLGWMVLMCSSSQAAVAVIGSPCLDGAV
jgi:hypothetical protein